MSEVDEIEARAAGLLAAPGVPATGRRAAATADVMSAILTERGARYGAYSGHAALSQALKATLATGASYGRLRATQREALEMICHKLARILNGDPDYADSWRDVAGFATLVAEELEGKR